MAPIPSQRRTGRRGGNQHLCGAVARPDRRTTRSFEEGRDAPCLQPEPRCASSSQRSDDHRVDAWRRTGQRPTVTDRQRLRPAYPSRSDRRTLQATPCRRPGSPRILNLGQGVAWDGWMAAAHEATIQRITPSMSKVATSLLSTSTPPFTTTRKSPELWLVASGVERLRLWCA